MADVMNTKPQPYRLQSVAPISRQAVLKVFSGAICSSTDLEGPVWSCLDGSQLKFAVSSYTDLFFVEFACQFQVVANGGVGFGDLGRFVQLCMEHGGRVKSVRNNSILSASEGAVLSDVFWSKAYRMARHLAEHPRNGTAQ